MQITNIPEFKKSSDYYKVISEKVKILKSYPWVIEVFQMGSLGCPGISDIDLVVVTEDGGFNGKGANIKNSEHGYYFLHDALWVRKVDFENLPYIFCATKIINPSINYRVKTVKEYTLSHAQKLIYLIEINFNKLLQLTNEIDQQINARTLLTHASSILHSVNLASDLGITNIEKATHYSNKIKDIRQRWLSSEGNVKIDYVELRQGLACALVNILNSTLKHNSNKLCGYSSSLIKLMFMQRKIKIGSKFIYDESKRQITIPETLIQYFSSYDKPNQTKLGRVQQIRKNALEGHCKYLKKNGLNYSLGTRPAVAFGTISILVQLVKNTIKYRLF